MERIAENAPHGLGPIFAIAAQHSSNIDKRARETRRRSSPWAPRSVNWGRFAILRVHRGYPSPPWLTLKLSYI